MCSKLTATCTLNKLSKHNTYPYNLSIYLISIKN